MLRSMSDRYGNIMAILLCGPGNTNVMGGYGLFGAWCSRWETYRESEEEKWSSTLMNAEK